MSKSVYTALHQLLMESSLEKLLGFLHGMKVQFSLVCDGKGRFRCCVFKRRHADGNLEQMFHYQRSDPSPKGAICGAIEMMLVSEDCDFHDFVREEWPDIKAKKQTAQRRRLAEEKFAGHAEWRQPK